MLGGAGEHCGDGAEGPGGTGDVEAGAAQARPEGGAPE